MMKTIRLITIALLLMFMFSPGFANAENYHDGEDETTVYTMVDEAGEEIASFGRRVYAGDEYISGDNMLYRVVSVDIIKRIATAKLLGPEPDGNYAETLAVFAPASAQSQSGDSENKLIAMYSTHSAESYVKGDGASFTKPHGGIYDIGGELKKELDAKGITVVYSDDTFHPHDAGAYRRSRSTAEELMKMRPAAIFDVHRDGIPDPEQYDKKVDGEYVTKVRLLVGHSNPSAAANRSFAKQIKKVADEEYPGFVKDIFIGRGNYNQELFPKSVLLEFGTYTSDKESVLGSAKYMADILEKAVFGGAASAEEESAVRADEGKSSGVGIAWFIGIAIVASLAYGLVATGTFKGMLYKVGRSVNEVTGGIIGKKPNDGEHRKDK